MFTKLFTSKITLILSFLLLAAGLIAGITLIRYPQILFPEAAGECPGPSPFMVYCTWDPVAGAVSYGFQVDEPSDSYPPSDPIYTTNTYFSFEARAGHTYVCYVHAVNDCGNKSVVAESAPWSCTASCPVVPTPNNLQVQTYTTLGLYYATFSWNPDDISNRYVLEVARSDQTLHDSCPNKQTTTCIDIHTLDKSTYCSSDRCSYDTLRVTNLEHGQYRWRVWAAKDIAGRSEACLGGPTNGPDFSITTPTPASIPCLRRNCQEQDTGWLDKVFYFKWWVSDAYSDSNCTQPITDLTAYCTAGTSPPTPTPGCGKTCVYSQVDPDGQTRCYSGNCLDGSQNCSFNVNCGWVAGCSSGTQVSCPGQPSPTPACPVNCDVDTDCRPPMKGFAHCADYICTLAGKCEKGGAGDGDVNTDGFVDGADASVLVANWGIPFGFDSRVDLNKDGKVNAIDASILMSNWKPR